MSNEIEPLADPGLPHHVHRKADTDPKAEKRAERQVSILFTLSSAGTLLFIYSFIWIPTDIFVFLPILGNVNAHNLGIGAGLGFALFFIGAGAVHWAKTLMPDEEVIAHRHQMRSSDEDRASFVETVKAEAGKVQLGRRSMIKRSLGLSLGLVGLSPIILLRDLGPLPEQKLLTTTWDKGVRVVTDPGNRPIKPEDLEVGAIAHILPEIKDPEHRKLSDIAKDAAILIRVRPAELKLPA